MKKVTRVLFAAAIVVATTMSIQAQNPNNLDPNANYKHQFPTSKGNKFKDSFTNIKQEDPSVRNYKMQPKYRKTENGSFAANFKNIQKTSTVNSKHPYGL